MYPDQDAEDPISQIRELADRTGLRSVLVLAFRDIDDPESGGSEIHVDRLIRNLASAGIHTTLHVGKVAGEQRFLDRDGANIIRAGGRITVFPRTVLDYWSGRLGKPDVILEVFHGVPFFAPLFATGTPQVGFIHHVHLGTWQKLLPGVGGRLGELIESKAVPAVYRHHRILTGAESAKAKIVESYGFDPTHIDVVPHGIDQSFLPGNIRHQAPTLLLVARLMPQKGVVRAVEAFRRVHHEVPDARLRIVGDGPQRGEIQALIDRTGMSRAVTLLGRVSHDQLIREYQLAWVVISASEAEGFGLTLLEAASCATPVVATDIPGHRDAMKDGFNGHLREFGPSFVGAIVDLLQNNSQRRSMQGAAVSFARTFSWEASALGIFRVLADEFLRSQ